MKKLLNINEAAGFLGVSEGALRGMVKRDYVPYIRLSPKTLRFDEEDLMKLLEKRKVKPWR